MSDYTDNQREIARQWAQAQAELDIADEDVWKAQRVRDAARNKASGLQDELAQFVGANRQKLLFSTEWGHVLVTYRKTETAEKPKRFISVELIHVV